MKGGGSLWLTGGEGALREAVSFRAGSPGFRGVLPLAEGGTEQEPASERPQMWGRGWGGRVGSLWEPRGPPTAQLEQAPGGDAGAKAGAGGPVRSPRRRQVPRAFRPVPRSLTKARGHLGGNGPLRRGGGRSGCVLCPRAQWRPRGVRRGPAGLSPFLWRPTCGGRRHGDAMGKAAHAGPGWGGGGGRRLEWLRKACHQKGLSPNGTIRPPAFGQGAGMEVGGQMIQETKGVRKEILKQPVRTERSEDTDREQRGRGQETDSRQAGRENSEEEEQCGVGTDT